MTSRCFLSFSVAQESRTPLRAAAGEGRLDLVEYLLWRGADVNASDNVRACRVERYALCCWRIHDGIRHPMASLMCQDGSTALTEAIWGRHLEVMQQLVNAGADVNTRSNVCVEKRDRSRCLLPAV